MANPIKEKLEPLSKHDVLFQATGALLSILIVVSGIAYQLIALFVHGVSPDIPEWQSLAIGAVVGYYLSRNGTTKPVPPHTHDEANPSGFYIGG